MKILYIITGLGIGGAEVQLINIINNLTDKKISPQNIKIIALTDCIQTRPVKVIEVTSLNLTKNPLTFIRALGLAKKIVENFKPDVVHTHMFHANIFSRFLRLLTPITYLINSAHSSNEGGKIRMITYRLTDFLCELTTNVSKMATLAFVKKKAFKPKKSITVYNGIDTNKFKFSNEQRSSTREGLKIKNNELLLTNVGRLVDVKDHQNLFYAFSKLKSIFPNTKLLIIGNGPLKNQLIKLAESISILEDIIFIDHTENVSNYLCASDLFILSSKYEGFPLSLVEAMSCKCLCISTNNGGQMEAFPENTRLTCPPQNSEKLYNTILSALNLAPLEKEKIIDECHSKATEHFNLKIISNKWFDIYTQAKNDK